MFMDKEKKKAYLLQKQRQRESERMAKVHSLRQEEARMAAQYGQGY
jgi:hypothetical protein